MKKIAFNSRTQSGFTLIEIIVSLVIAAILGAMLIQFMGSNLSRSAETVVRIKDGYQLRDEMEKITRDYRDWLTGPDNPITDFRDNYVNDPTASWASFIVGGGTGTIEVDTGNDGDVEILQVTISDEWKQRPQHQTLTSLFTK